MNYKNKREVKAGDYVIGRVADGIIAGRVAELTGKCVILYPVQGRTVFDQIDPAEFFHAEDAVDACELFMSGKVVPIRENSSDVASSTPGGPAQGASDLNTAVTARDASTKGGDPTPAPVAVAPPGIFPNIVRTGPDTTVA